MSIHVLLHMAEYQSPITSEVLGKSMGVNPVVLRRTMAGLREAGLVSTGKGHGGGWSVARELKDISLLDIYLALEEPMLIQQHRNIENPECFVEQTVGHVLNTIFQEAEELATKRFETIKLADLSAEFHLRLNADPGKRRKCKSHISPTREKS